MLRGSHRIVRPCHSIFSMELPTHRPRRTERVPLVRLVSYEVMTFLEATAEPNAESGPGQAVLLTISQGGMLLLTTCTLPAEVSLLVDNAAFRDALQVYGLGEVVWTCPVYLAPELYLVGVRFLE